MRLSIMTSCTNAGSQSGKLSSKRAGLYALSGRSCSMVCEIIADDTCQSGVTPEMKTAFMEAMNVLLHGIEAELQIGRAPDNQYK